EEGTPTMHVAIIARGLNIPVIAQIKDITEKIDSLDNIIVDGESGNIFIRPSEELLGSFSTKLKEREQRQAEYEAIKDKPSVTKDGIKIGLHLNAGLLHDLPLLKETSADGIGLYRTEIPFMSYPEMPDVNIQSNLYKKIIDEAENKPVIFRTLDIGADKMLPYCKDLVEDNPAIGWRSIRITLDRKGVLRSQFRALIRAAQGRELYIMFPMISEVAEFDAAKETLLIELQREKDRNGIIPKKLHVGTMLEVPALAFQLPALLKRVDFISVGSNDLMQFLFASDRGNQRLAQRYDELSPSFLRLLKNIALECSNAGVSCSLCGEMAGNPLKAMALIGLGFRNLSIRGHNFGQIKMMLQSLDVKELELYLDTQLDSIEHSLRPRLHSFAIDHGIVI
ncbi:MAG: phosphoenolpyruvate--protein phosphotransferase, partial [Alphaproteobacteria bacterium]|nr:phosphoenolpyruvate--protein phosphotransferase [Alphaproteobacteria bacterium]